VGGADIERHSRYRVRPEVIRADLIREAALQLYLGFEVPARYLDGIASAERAANERERANLVLFKRRRT
jgi:hypothetical protein